jgi:hypothetical protein
MIPRDIVGMKQNWTAEELHQADQECCTRLDIERHQRRILRMLLAAAKRDCSRRWIEALSTELAIRRKRMNLLCAKRTRLRRRLGQIPTA